jgi:uncharacterized DUF497 family protein
MEIEYDPAKNERNIERRGLSFDLAAGFDFETALIRPDLRHDYGESRYQAYGMIGSRLHFLAFSLRNGAIRIISLRKANTREVRFYEQETRSDTD